MNRHAVGVVIAGFLGGVAGAVGGCNFIVGAGDYAVGADAGTILHAEGGADGSKSHDGGPNAHGGRLGDPCTKNSQCTHGTCGSEWCTSTCTSNSACGSNSSGEMNSCVPNSNGEFICVPGCSTPADCLNYPGTTCAQIEGGTAFVCTLETPDGGFGDGGDGGGIIGDPCSDDGGVGCSTGTCNGSWCQANCSSSNDTSCGSNSVGVPNSCASTGSGFVCFPGCSTNGDCTPYIGTTCTPNVIGSPDAGFSCSDPNGEIGDPCSNSASSPWLGCTGDEDAGTGGDGGSELCYADTWCSVPCASSTDTSCDSSSTGQSNHCVPTTAVDGGTEFWCFPGCTAAGDCAPYPNTFCEPIFSGGSGSICSASGGGIGDPCTTDANCTQGTCLGSWCNEVCSPAGSTTVCGQNSAGTPNVCILDTDMADHCFPGCTTDADCVPYPGGPTCQAISGSMVCSF
jgi:hypothetical protein